MKLTHIRLTGFKSFAHHVELPFDDGMTAIVGPNGCGKSNISDAVRWVLGEQRARLLRGERMEDIIFHGAAKHRPVNVAEVSLVFDNSDGTLPIAYHEVEVARRLSRSGQSDYLINQSPVRLRDVQDLLRGTGLGSDAGVVIEAQMIDRLLSDKAEERRSLFEEAAGIGLYRDRKTTTERQLERTTDDLQRLDDIINEVQREVRSLARQRGKAERYTQFTAQRFAIVMTLARHDLGRYDDEARALAEARSEIGAQLPAAHRAVADRERGREDAGQVRHAAEARRTELERRLAATRLEVERLEGNLKLAGERMQNAAERKARAQAEHDSMRERAVGAERDREAAASERAAAAEARVSVQGELDLRTESEEEVRRRLTAVREAVAVCQDRLQEHAEQARALAGERGSLERDLADLREQLAQAEQARAQHRVDLENAERRLREARSETETRHDEVRNTEAELERARHALAAAREHEGAIRTERRTAEEMMARRTARRDALERLEREHEGLAPAARRLLQAKDRFGDGAVLGPLSDFLTTSRADAHLAERLFGEWLHAVLVTDNTVVESIRRWHEEHRPGPLMLLPATGPEGPEDHGDEPLPVAARGPAAAWARALLRGHDVLDDAGRAIRRPNGAVVLSGDTDGSGPLARRADLDALRAEINEAQGERDRLEHELERAARAHEEAERTLATASEQAERARQAHRDAQGTADDAGRILQRVERDLAEAETMCARLSERVAKRRSRLAQVTDEMDGAEAERARLEEDLAGRRSALSEIEAQQEAARERRVHWQVEEAQVAAREQAAREREERAEAVLADAREEITSLEREMEQIERDTGTLTEQRQEWTDALAERRVAAQEMEAAARSAETAVSEAEARVAALEHALAEARDTLAAVSERSHRLDIEQTELEGRRHAMIERIEGEWHRPINELLEEAEVVEGDLAALRAEADRLTQVLETMGPVNPLAVEEHAETVQRLEFLTGQCEDLVAARNKLGEALREIEVTAREMFVKTFAAIRENFHDVFQMLFDGGECDVRLADENDPLESDIEIHAAPRGKRAQRIHLLSSGERALVAISLLFAIYLTKPSPFCLLDEVDAPLDDANVVRFIKLLSGFKQDTQFIVITHNPRTMQVADNVYGVTMQEPGVSTIVGVRLGEVEPV